MRKILLFAFSLILITSCSKGTEDSNSGGGLIATQKPVSNGFSFIAPSEDNYSNGSSLDFNLSHSYELTVKGSPRIQLTIGSSTLYANYVSGSGSKTITFRYTIKPGDNDSDGIEVANSIDLNGGSITFAYNGKTKNADPAISGGALNNVLVNTSDATPPTIMVVTPPSAKTYLTSESLDFVVTYNKVVNVMGTPQLVLDIGGQGHYAQYLSGSGSNSLTFRYIIQSSDNDGDGIGISSPIDLNSGAITGSTYVDASLSFLLPDTSQVLVNNTTTPTVSIDSAPTINSLNSLSYIVSGSCSDNGQIVTINVGSIAATPTCSGSAYTTSAMNVSSLADSGAVAVTADHNSATQASASVIKDTIAPIVSTNSITSGPTHVINDSLTMNVNFDDNITVTGTPRILLTFDNEASSPTYATYASGSGTNTLIFNYSIALGDGDSNGPSSAAAIELNSGSILDNNGNPVNLALVTTSFPSITIDGLAPTITNVAIASNTYTIGNFIDVVVTFSKNVTFSGTNSRIQLTFETMSPASIYANYFSGSGSNIITYRYAVTPGNEDTNGIDLAANIDLNSDTAVDSYGNAAVLSLSSSNFPAVLVDAIIPTVTISSAPTINTLNVTNYTVSGSCSEDGQIVTLDIGGIAATPTCSSGAYTASGIDVSSIADSSGIAITADHADAGGNNAIQATANVLKDTVKPVVAITASANINIANQYAYNLSGSCDENGESIALSIGGSVFNSTCTSGAWSENINVSGIADSLNVAITADINDVAGNPADQVATTVIKDTVIPTVAITNSPDISGGNVSSYQVIGSCSEDGQNVSVQIGSIAVAPTCTSGSWITGNIDVSSLADGTVNITADIADSAGNDATQAATSVNKNTATPTVTINTPAPNISSANETAYQISGTCSENGRIVSVAIGSLSFSPNCNSGVWNTAMVDVSSLADGTVNITADHDNASAIPAPQASTSVTKDSTAPTVTISMANDINASNESSYMVTGSCSENGRIVDVYIEALNFTPTCSNGAWSTGSIDVSSLADGSVLITADHDNASATPAVQATITINKETSAPTVTSLSVPSTLVNDADLVWSLVDPSASTIEDYIINYRVKGTTTWLAFDDGVNTVTNSTVTGLNASTIYEFQVAVIYNSGQQSSWSNIAEGETKPDSPLFGANIAMNVGGATDSTVVALEDNTNIILNGNPLVTLNKGQTHRFTSVEFDVIDADKPIYTAGKRGNGGSSTRTGNITWNPTTWAGKTFSFNATRNNPQELRVFAIEAATIEVRQGSTVLDSATVAADSGTTLSWSIYGSYQVISTGTILAYHSSGTGSTIVDTKPLLPSHTEIIGFPSSSMRITSDLDATNYSFVHGNSVTGSGSLNKQDVVQVNPEGPSNLYSGYSLLISADKNISGASFADGDGNSASVFLPTNLMKHKYAVNVSSDFVAFASKEAGTIDVLDSNDNLIETLTLSRTGSDPNAPYNARRATTPAGYRFISTAPVAAWYQPNSSTGGSNEDETILYGSD